MIVHKTGHSISPSILGWVRFYNSCISREHYLLRRILSGFIRTGVNLELKTMLHRFSSDELFKQGRNMGYYVVLPYKEKLKWKLSHQKESANFYSKCVAESPSPTYLRSCRYLLKSSYVHPHQTKKWSRCTEYTKEMIINEKKSVPL